MEGQTDPKISAKVWAKIVIEQWVRKIRQLKIMHTRSLLQSFHHYVNTQANGNPDLIIFTFNYYGKFVDLGVGKGVTYDKIELSNRKPKPWYSKTFYSQLMKLWEILQERYCEKAQFEIITEIEKI
jgi:hypothetical protein